MTVRETLGRLLRRRREPDFVRSDQYWQDRYVTGGKSGAGSVGRLARFKADVLNRFVADHAITSVLELGSGDGSQLELAAYPDYTGIDISEAAVAMCRKRFAGDSAKRFLTAIPEGQSYDLTMSLDVIYHLIEDSTFADYLGALFAASREWVVIYSSNMTHAEAIERFPEFAATRHVTHRRFSDWVDENQPGWTLFERIANRFPYDTANPDKTSFADFYVYRKRQDGPAGGD